MATCTIDLTSTMSAAAAASTRSKRGGANMGMYAARCAEDAVRVSKSDWEVFSSVLESLSNESTDADVCASSTNFKLKAPGGDEP
jgi:hypothetical protein